MGIPAGVEQRSLRQKRNNLYLRRFVISGSWERSHGPLPILQIIPGHQQSVATEAGGRSIGTKVINR